MANHQCRQICFCGHTGWWHCPHDGPCAAKHLLLPHPRPQAWLQAESHQWRHHLVFQLIHGFWQMVLPKSKFGPAKAIQGPSFACCVPMSMAKLPSMQMMNHVNFIVLPLNTASSGLSLTRSCWTATKIAYQAQLLHQEGLCTVATSHWLDIFETCPNVEPAIAGKGHNQTSHTVLP